MHPSLPPTPSFLHFTPPITPPHIASSLRRHFLFSFVFPLSAIHLPPAVCICPGFPSRDERISRSDVLDNCRTPESPGIETTQPAAFSQCFYHDSDRRRYLSNKELTLLIRIHCLSLSLCSSSHWTFYITLQLALYVLCLSHSTDLCVNICF